MIHCPTVMEEKLVALNLDRIWHWIGYGAYLSKPMEKLLGLSGIFPSASYDDHKC
jgi:small subunit ribosomal protein S16